MTKFLFWNIYKKPLLPRLSRIVSNYDVDVIVLVESLLDTTDVLRALNRDKTDYHYASSTSNCGKVTIFTRFSDSFIPPIFENDRSTIRHLQLPGKTGILLAATHAPSKMYYGEYSQGVESGRLANLIKEAEESVKHTRTILVGDLNMNPFEVGVIGAGGGLNAVMSKAIAKKGTRTIQKEEYPFFYNPMWGRFGDTTPGPPGTYYYKSTDHVSYYWNIFDQVLIRPELIDLFDDSSLEVLESDGENRLLAANDLPDTNNGSDHLPILFILNL